MDNHGSDKKGTYKLYGCCTCTCMLIVVDCLVLYYCCVIVPWSNFQLLAPDRESDHLTDTEMLNLFHARHVPIETIISMCQADLRAKKNIEIVDYTSYRGDGLTPERLEAYNSVLHSLGIRGNGGLSAAPEKPIYVTISTSGNIETGSEKGFDYSTTKLIEIDEGTAHRGHEHNLRRLAGRSAQ